MSLTPSAVRPTADLAFGSHNSQLFTRMLKFQQLDCEKPLARLSTDNVHGHELLHYYPGLVVLG